MINEPGGMQPLSSPGGEQKRNLSARVIGVAVLALVAVLFILQNRERKSVDFLVFEINSRQWANIAAAMLIGAALDRLILGWWHRRKRD